MFWFDIESCLVYCLIFVYRLNVKIKISFWVVIEYCLVCYLVFVNRLTVYQNKKLFWFDIESCLVYCSLVGYQLVNSISQSTSWEIYAAKTYFSYCIPCHEFARFSNVIKTKGVCVAFLQQRGGLHSAKGCETRENPMTLNPCENGDRWWCFMRICHTEVGLRKSTWLDNSNLPFGKVVLICYCWSKESISIRFCKNELGINKNTVVAWNKFVREVNTADLLANPG